MSELVAVRVVSGNRVHEAGYPAMTRVERGKCTLAFATIRKVRTLRNHGQSTQTEVHVGAVVDRFAEGIGAAEQQPASEVPFHFGTQAVVVRVAAVVANRDCTASRVQARQI